MLVVGGAFTWWQWDWLHGKDPATTASTTLRNMGLLIGGGLAVVFAMWRGWVAERQSVTAKLSLLNERFQKGAEMLGSDVLAVRLSGIYGLQELAKEYPERYHVQVMQFLCAYVRNPPGTYRYEGGTNKYGVLGRHQDVTLALEFICYRSKSQMELERKVKFEVNLEGSDLHGQDLRAADLSGANLSNSNLSTCGLMRANLSKAKLAGADFSNPRALSERNERDVPGSEPNDLPYGSSVIADVAAYGFLFEANLTGSSFSIDGDFPAQGLIQAQLDYACAEPDNPPCLKGVRDAVTGNQLFWKDKPL